MGPVVEDSSDKLGLRVICHAGYRADEYPEAFVLHGKRHQITEILAAWQTPVGRFFRVRCEDKRDYELCCAHTDGVWSLV